MLLCGEQARIKGWAGQQVQVMLNVPSSTKSMYLCQVYILSHAMRRPVSRPCMRCFPGSRGYATRANHARFTAKQSCPCPMQKATKVEHASMLVTSKEFKPTMVFTTLDLKETLHPNTLTLFL